MQADVFLRNNLVRVAVGACFLPLGEGLPPAVPALVWLGTVAGAGAWCRVLAGGGHVVMSHWGDSVGHGDPVWFYMA